MKRGLLLRHKWLAILVALLAGFALAETVVRTCLARVPARPASSGDLFVESAAPARGYELVRGARAHWDYPRADGTCRAIDLELSDDGWRGAHFEPRPTAGVTRIACVGDSQTFGWGVGDDETLPQELSRALYGLAPHVPLEVLNLGVPNTNLEHKAAWIESYALDLGCRAIVLQLFFDDLLLDGVEAEMRPREERELAQLRAGGRPWLDFLRRHLVSVDLAVDGMYRRAGAEAYAAMYERLLKRGDPSRERLAAVFAHLAELARARGVEIVCVLYPLPVRVNDGFATEAVDRELIALAREAGLPALDVGPAWLATEEALSVHPLDHHASPAAHRIAAGEIARLLADRGALGAAK